MSRKGGLIINRDDHARLTRLFAGDFASVFSDKPYLADLRRALVVAQVVAPGDIPHDVVTMNSTVRLRDLQFGDVETYRLVYPEDAHIAEGRMSILAPIGTAILGSRVGERVRSPIPGGAATVQIEELIFQPERDGVAV